MIPQKNHLSKHFLPIIKKCTKILINGQVMPLCKHELAQISSAHKTFGLRAERVIAVAMKPLNACDNTPESNLIFLGLFGIFDPPRKEVKKSIKTLKGAGLKTIMITGDHPETAFAVAKEIGIAKNFDEVITGQELKKLSKKEKKALSEEEKEFRSLRKQIQQKLIKFATRIPIFMYLTDFRECTLKDVITQLEPELFKKVTGLGIKDFSLLCELNIFNSALMNDAIFKFKRYEDASLVYTGIDKHHDEDIGGWDTIIKREEYDKLF